MSNTNERADLIAELRGSADLLQIGKVEDWGGLAAEILQAADMLEADVLQLDKKTVWIAEVKPGWALVPIVPTPAILDAMSSSGWKTACYKAMLAAAQEVKPVAKPDSRPQNCGTGHCSCIECPYKKEKS